MPKQKYSFIQKLKVVYWFLAGKKGYGLIECCGVCGSMKVIRKMISFENKQVYRAKYKCLDCGSVARAKEKWRGKKC